MKYIRDAWSFNGAVLFRTTLIFMLMLVSGKAFSNLVFEQIIDSCSDSKICNTPPAHHIMSMDDDGTNIVDLSYDPYQAKPFYDELPSISRDGTKIAFWSTRQGGEVSLYTMNANGTGITNLVPSGGAYAFLAYPNESKPVWSPDNSEIITSAVIDNTNYSILRMNADGTNIRLIYSGPTEYLTTSWSQDGLTVLVTDRTTRGVAELDLASGTFTPLTDDPTPDDVYQNHAVYSLDGSSILFRAVDSTTSGTYLSAAGGVPIWPANLVFDGLLDPSEDRHENWPAFIGTNHNVIVMNTTISGVSYLVKVTISKSQTLLVPLGPPVFGLSWGPTLRNRAPIADAGVDQTVHIGQPASLDGSASYDPDMHYPLSYQWRIVDGVGTLTNEATVSPTFERETVGDTTVGLTVTDALGAVSQEDTVVLSTSNAAPVADAGMDQAVIALGAPVQLDGSNSYDPDGDPLTYGWTIVSQPTGSLAVLDADNVVNPSFVPDVQGNYEFQLTVDDPWTTNASSDNVIISFTNVAPVAVTNGNQAVTVGDVVALDGSSSSDANNDPLTYTWSLVSVPAGSAAMLSALNGVSSSFTADVSGTYVVSLVVNDGLVDSPAANANIVASTVQEQAVSSIQDAVSAINQLALTDPSIFQFNNAANNITNKLTQALSMIDLGNTTAALNDLQNALMRTDGCAGPGGTPDATDWVNNCDDQAVLYPLIIDAINLLQGL